MFHDFSQKKIAVVALILLLLSGSIFSTVLISKKLGDNFVLNTLAQTKISITSFAYRFNLSRADEQSLTASVASVFNNAEDTETGVTNTKLVPVLLYHGIVKKSDVTNLSREKFEEHMFSLKRAGWKTVGYDDFRLFMRGGKELPEKSFLLTFDDGRKDSYYPVDPILKALGYSATMFVISDRFEESFHLSKDELLTMQKSGRWDIESHGHADHDLIQIDEAGTKGHFLTNKMWLVDESRLETDAEFETRISTDLAYSKENLGKIFNKEITGFAFPFGDYGQRSENYPGAEEVVRRAVAPVYPLVYYQVWDGQVGIFNYPSPNATSTFIKRIKPTEEWTGEDLISLLEKSSAKELPINDDFSRDIGWKKMWGQAGITESALRLDSGTSTSAGVMLDGTQHFENYTLSANITDSRTKTFTVFGRYRDADNYIACTYGVNLITLVETVKGVKRTAFTSKINLPALGGVTVGTEAAGNKFGCTLNGTTVAYTEFTRTDLDKGSIGFFVWSPEKNAKINISNVSIKK